MKIVKKKPFTEDSFHPQSDGNKNISQLCNIGYHPQRIEPYLHAIFNNTIEPVFVKNAECRLFLVNDAFCTTYGLCREDIVGKTLAEKLSSSEREHFLSVDKQVLKDGIEILCEESVLPNGIQAKTVVTRKTRFIDPEGNYFLIGVIHDITLTKQLEQEKTAANEAKDKRLDELIVADREKYKRADELIIANKEKEYLLRKLKRAASVFASTHESIIITDASGIIVEVNNAFSQITGYAPEDVMGQNISLLRSERQAPEFHAEMLDVLLMKGLWLDEVWNRRKNGDIYPEMMTVSAVNSTTGILQNLVFLGTDTTEIKAYQDQLEHIIHFDVMTNLPNRVLLSDRLSQSMIQCQRNKRTLAIAFIDLDDFKLVNDQHGHKVGDELLIAVSKRMKSVLREGDTLARIGGDEFIALMVNLENPEDSAPVLERLLRAAADPVYVDNSVIQVSASIGVTIYPQDGVNSDELMRHADQAMYSAKLEGKNRYCLFDNALSNAVKIQVKSIGNIRLALDKHEFVLHYQPKVNMQTGEVIGAEALIRWDHPELGLGPHLEFLPMIEGKPISIELGEWVIDSALTQISQWQSVGLNLAVSVNISAHQLQQDNFATRLAVLLSVHPEVNPSYLELEILETSALEDISKVSATMNVCKLLGVRFALDDFGTGYSSLTYLRRLPVDLIKIDQSFVCGMLENPDDCAIVEGVIGLAKAFEREVIAEGVETIAHGVALQLLGCDLAQGFGIARPMPAEDFLDWFSDWKTGDSWHYLKVIERNRADG